MVCKGRKEWLPALKAMWKEAFGDGDAFMEAFFRDLYQEELTWCWVDNARPVSVIYGIPVTIQTENGDETKACYLYAGATAGKERGKGYYGRLLRCVSRLAEGPAPQFGALLLVPAPGLAPYYEKLGFRTLREEAGRQYTLPESAGQHHGFPESVRRLPVRQESSVQLQPEYLQHALRCNDRYSFSETGFVIKEINARRYGMLRRELLGGPGFVDWDDRFLEFAVRSAVLSGGAALEILLDGKRHILLGEVNTDCLLVEETTMTDQELVRVTGAVELWRSCRQVRVRDTVLMAAGDTGTEAVPYFKIPLN